MESIIKYPSTPHLEGSRLQGDDAAKHKGFYPIEKLAGEHIVVEEKIDGANAGISFDPVTLELRTQSRGHFLLGGRDDEQFALLKRWANAHEAALMEALQDRYVLYGEWCYQKHSVFYDALPHLFFAFDVLDRKTGEFLSTPARQALTKSIPLVSVPVIYQGPAPGRIEDYLAMIGPSLGKSKNWEQALDETIARRGLNRELTWQQTDSSGLAEGLYIKIEDGDRTIGRLKLVRQSFTQTILESGSHYRHRPVVPNGVKPEAELFAPGLTADWTGVLGSRGASATSDGLSLEP